MWCKLHKVLDPVGNHPQYKHLVACFLMALIHGHNIRNKLKMRSKTIRKYAEAVNMLFTLRNVPPPYIPGDKANECHSLISGIKEEEDIANQRNPLDEKIATESIKLGRKAHRNSAESLFMNLLCLARYIGPRVSEYGCETQQKITYHTWPASGETVVRPWILSDFRFFAKNGDVINLAGRTSDDINVIIKEISHMTVTWRIQKNRQNGQRLKLPTDKQHLDICPVYNALQIVMRKLRLDRSNLDNPLCVFAKKGSITPLYITGKKIKDILQSAVKLAYPNISKEDLQKYTAHSLRVWPCVLLDEANKPPQYIQSRLRWLGDSYRLYLRDTFKSSNAHRDALFESSLAIMDAISEDSEGILDESYILVDDAD